MHVNIGTLLPRHATYRPHHTAVLFKDHPLTYRQINGRVNRIANALVQLGLQKGDKLATIAPKRFILTDGECEGYQNYGALTAVSPKTDPPHTDVHEEDPYNIIYSSGTTALPNYRYKAVPGNHMTMLFGDNVAMLAKEITMFLEES